MTRNRYFYKKIGNSVAFRHFRNFMYWPFVGITWFPAVILFKSHIGEITPITGESMYPTFNVNFNKDLRKDVCWTNKRDPTKNLERGMIVSVRNPFNPETLQIKRILAIEGDTVFTRAPCPVSTVQVPINHIWVEGDNQDASKTLDSNSYGPIPLNMVQGKITHILFPLDRLGRVRWWDYGGNPRILHGDGDSGPD